MGATPGKTAWSAARTEATLVPCQLGTGQAGPESPGSVKSASRPSPSIARVGSEMKSYPSPTCRNAENAGAARPESSSATTTSGVELVSRQTDCTWIPYGSLSRRFQNPPARKSLELSAAVTSNTSE